jgi:hypothetical protein
MTFPDSLTPDAPVALNASYQLDATDRRYIDDQIRAVQQMLTDLLVAGKQATLLEVSLSSATLVQGDVVCASPSVTGRVVTLATPEALAVAGRPCGLVLAGAAPGSMVQVATFGIVPPSVTGLSTAGSVRVSSVGRCEVASLLSGADHLVGVADSSGSMTLAFMAPRAGAESATYEWSTEPTSVTSGSGDVTLVTIPVEDILSSSTGRVLGIEAWVTTEDGEDADVDDLTFKVALHPSGALRLGAAVGGSDSVESSPTAATLMMYGPDSGVAYTVEATAGGNLTVSAARGAATVLIALKVWRRAPATVAASS